MKMNEKIAFIVYEGDTEEIFYRYIFDKYLNKAIERRYKNLETGCGINKEVAKQLLYFTKLNKNKSVYTYVFLDREGPRTKIPEFNANWIKKYINESTNSNISCKVQKIEAIKMIESWFFYDLEGICDYIGIPVSDNLKRKYANPEKFSSVDLSKLFQKGIKNRYYRKGDSRFLNKLDKDKIYRNCDDLRNGIDMINRDFS